MPSFQAPLARSGSENKRKNQGQDPNPRPEKRPNIGLRGNILCWMVQWRAPQYKKHKTWDGDGVWVIEGTGAQLFDLDGKIIATGKFPHQDRDFGPGTPFDFAGKEVETDHPVDAEDYLSGRCFGRGGTAAPASNPQAWRNPANLTKKFVPLQLVSLYKAPTRIQPPVAREKPKLSVKSIPLTETSIKDNIAHTASSWSANWRKPQTKKHKTFDGDAFVLFGNSKVTLLSEEGKIMGVSDWDGFSPFAGYSTFLGGKEVRLDCEVALDSLPNVKGTASDFLTGMEDIPREPLAPRAAETVSILNSPAFASSKKFVAPISVDPTRPPPPVHPQAKAPIHDPDAEGAVVMKQPTEEHNVKNNKAGVAVGPVIIDPILSRRLRPHQIEGVKFLYEAVMGLRKHEGQGCILADEMGLGKTLQTITLVWTLLRQNPHVGKGPVIGKVLIVCPVSLVNNWRKEFHKWLGKDRVGVFVGDKNKVQIKQFINSKIHHVLIIGYEKLRTVIEDLAYCNPPIGLIICDEGHRLKSAESKVSKMFEALRTPRRIILSGTPIQNDLSEFHAMADFCNPGLLDDYASFKRVFEGPILKGRAPGALAKHVELGEARSAQLMKLSESFVLRREAKLLNNYLPPKYEYVVFVTPTKLQTSIFNKILQKDLVSSLEGSTAKSLALIGTLTKISNSPMLLRKVNDKGTGEGFERKTVQGAVELLPPDAELTDVSLSGKLSALAKILGALHEKTDEKCIVVSHYTSTLDIIEGFCKKKRYPYFRLDGQTPVPKRQEYVDTFNKSSRSQSFVFLLSAKAGGVGLNLIGASRLCLVDSDWNPSHDLQSMARIHRDGQKRPVFIYRLLTTGTIDEKIYQRQVIKLALSESLIGSDAGDKSKSDSFAAKDLRDLFSIHPRTCCQTHDLLECPCSQKGYEELPADASADDESDPDPLHEEGPEERRMSFMSASQVRPQEVEKNDKLSMKKKKEQLASLGQWSHINCLLPNAGENIRDEVLAMLVPANNPMPKLPSSRIEERVDLLDVLDLDRIESSSDAFTSTTESLPEASITFVFERSSTTDSEVQPPS